MIGTRGGSGRVYSRGTLLLVSLLSLGAISAPAAESTYKASVNSKAVSRPLISPQQQAYEKRNAFVWKADPAQPITRIEVSIPQQKIFAFQGDKLVVEGPVCTGKPGRDTPRGNFVVQEKDADHVSGSFGAVVDSNGRTVNSDATPGSYVPSGAHYEGAPMPHFMRLTGYGVGMHAGFLPGYAASHGCIRLPRELAAKLYDAVNVGTPVMVTSEAVSLSLR